MELFDMSVIKRLRFFLFSFFFVNNECYLLLSVVFLMHIAMVVISIENKLHVD